MLRSVIVLAMCCLVSACTSVVTFTQQDGTTGYEAYCSGFAKQQCANRAAQQCAQGYVVLTDPQIQSRSASKLMADIGDNGSSSHLYFACK